MTNNFPLQFPGDEEALGSLGVGFGSGFGFGEEEYREPTPPPERRFTEPSIPSQSSGWRSVSDESASHVQGSTATKQGPVPTVAVGLAKARTFSIPHTAPLGEHEKATEDVLASVRETTGIRSSFLSIHERHDPHTGKVNDWRDEAGNTYTGDQYYGLMDFKEAIETNHKFRNKYRAKKKGVNDDTAIKQAEIADVSMTNTRVDTTQIPTWEGSDEWVKYWDEQKVRLAHGFGIATDL
ncbi:uncharacterized protein I303_107406 [Kwoniella dejecticola CBS 10117]|uniref:Uncharacterized protein n=1 Tax=Kwoniella dejecticola CBS 10117 TaxID=1296121 RepID=A0A1A5ZZL5_9TREE|nr:uncharacterized protein I303_06810 [Kwoniella dejecticola CBS 10117]OBR83249.1 hypothetical protein I303_06810 [Kwoniella dejecticola CBS 10117]